MSNGKIKFHDNQPDINDMYEDIIQGFSNNPRCIPPKYFYNEEGSQLFDLITQTQDYYPTRTEVSIFNNYKQDIVCALPEHCVLIEPGGGSYSKAMLFIEDLYPSVYVPIDISKDYLQTSVNQLSHILPWLNIQAVCDDFTQRLVVPEDIESNHRVLFFPGSSIGNFDPVDVVAFLNKAAKLVGNNGQLLIGVDLKKDSEILRQAYDDNEGITAKFNLNLLTRLNDELGANFDLQCWQHQALYNTDIGRIEMYLQSMCEQVVIIKDYEYYFNVNECIHTENSYKYTIDEFVCLAQQAGFNSQNVWLDKDELFSVHLFNRNH